MAKVKKKSNFEEKNEVFDIFYEMPSKKSDFPAYIDPATGKFRKGISPNPGGHPKGLINQSSRIKKQILDFFENNYLNKGKFMKWVRLPGNERKFFDYCIKNVMPRDINMQIDGEGDLAQTLKEARARKAPETTT